MIKGPIFLVGAERSGTTLLRLMLDHHPEIAFLPEFEFAVELVGLDGAWPDLSRFYELLAVRREFADYQLSLDRGLDYPRLVDSFLQQKRARDQKLLVGATVHRHFDRLLHVWPDARFVHLVRDPRNVAMSAIGMGWAGNPWTGVDRWLEAESLWDTMEDVPSVEARYEKLVSDAAGTLGEICRFLGLEFHPAMFDYAKTTTYDLPDPRRAFGSTRQLTEREIRLVEARAGEMLVARGYELSGLPRLVLSRRLERRLLLQDRWERIRFRTKRYGWRLFLADLISRRARVASWQRRVRLRLNEVERAHLK